VEPNKPNEVVVNKELVSTTIVSEKYGKFELSANSMILNYMEIQRDLLFANGTNFNYLLDETIELYNSFNILDEMLLKEDCVVGILANTGTSGKFMSDGSVTMGRGRDTYFKLPNNTLIYPTDGVPTDLKYESYPTILFPDKQGNHDNDITLDIMVNVFVKDYEYIVPLDSGSSIEYIFKSPMLVISTTGVPLTEKIYNEIMKDPTTQITKNYKE
ncbi:MAG TPA: hypothetical protein PLZ09_03065, partial [Clostridia bacterium]|nr:hypothetical protein [Clostridia bacterium]